MFEKTSENTPFVTDLASKTDPDSSPRRSGAPLERSGASRSAPGTLGGRSGEASETLRDVVRTLPGRPGTLPGRYGRHRGTPKSSQASSRGISDRVLTRRSVWKAPRAIFHSFWHGVQDRRHAFRIGFYSTKRLSSICRMTSARARKNIEK